MGRAEVADEESRAVCDAEEGLVRLRLEVDVEDVTAAFLGSLGVAIPVVCRATGGYDSNKELSSSNTCPLDRRDVLLLSSEKTAETISEAKSATDEMS